MPKQTNQADVPSDLESLVNHILEQHVGSEQGAVPCVSGECQTVPNPATEWRD